MIVADSSIEMTLLWVDEFGTYYYDGHRRVYTRKVSK